MLGHGNEYGSLEMTSDSWIRIVFSAFNEGMAEVAAFFFCCSLRERMEANASMERLSLLSAFIENIEIST